MNDASSRPHHSPARVPQPVVRKNVHLRWKHWFGPVQIAERVGLAPYLGRRAGDHNRIATKARTGTKNAYYGAKVGTAFVHTVTDDHSRVGYAEIHDDEAAATAAGVLYRAVAWFAVRGVVVERVLSDSGSAYRGFGA